ncbi:hypothetical protein PENTCL1PPCAC_5042, partial [Pristionchus entomophagus]
LLQGASSEGMSSERAAAGTGAIRRVNDIVHTSIALPRPLDVIVDTVEFQRLRNVKQLGAAPLVFPSGNHTRFTHSIGTCHIAQLVLEKLRSDRSLAVTDEDVLCVSIAALCHDIGHGPFSHLYDGPFMAALKMDGPGQWTHEAGSKAILRRVFEYPRVERALREYLGGSDNKRYFTNLEFIIELISPPEMLDHAGEWVPKGRPIDKSFLYDIVSNVHDGFDVDKFDYVLRDSMMAGFGIRFSKESMLRVIDNIRVLPCPRLGFKRICFATKTADDLLSLADSRHVLHARVYQHKTVGLIEAMIVKAFIAAEPHLKFRKNLRLSTIHSDVDVFCRVDDSILQIIANSEGPDLEKAREYLSAISERNLAKRVAYFECSPNENMKLRGIAKDRIDVAKRLESTLVDVGKAYGVIDDDIYVISRRIYSGLDGYRHPMSEALVYDNKEKHPVPRRLDSHWLVLRASQHTTLVSFALYLSRSLPESTVDILLGEFKTALKGYGIDVNRSNEGPSPKKIRAVENNN